MAAALTALGVATPTIEPVGHAIDARSAKINQTGAQMQQEAAALRQIAEMGLGVMGGKVDGQVDPASFDQMLGLLEGNPLAEKLKGSPELLPLITRGSIDVLKAAQDGQQFELAKKKFDLDMRTAEAALRKSQFVEVSPGATLRDTTGKLPDYTAPVKAGEGTTDQQNLAQINTERQAAGKPPIDLETYIAGKSSDGMSVMLPDGTSFSLGGKGINKYDMDEGSRLSKLTGEIASAGRNGTSAKARLSQMRELLSNPDVYTGIGGQQVLALQRFASLFDPAAKEAVQDTETFNSFSKQAALDLMGGSLGAGFSNADRAFVEAQVANIENTKEGNLQLIDVLTKLADHQVKVAKFTTDYKKAHGNRLDSEFEGELADWAEANPIFGETAPVGDTSAGATTGIPAGAKTQTLEGKTYYTTDDGKTWFEAD
jgi:hypothetical protein